MRSREFGKNCSGDVRRLYNRLCISETRNHVLFFSLIFLSACSAFWFFSISDANLRNFLFIAKSENSVFSLPGQISQNYTISEKIRNLHSSYFLFLFLHFSTLSSQNGNRIDSKPRPASSSRAAPSPHSGNRCLGAPSQQQVTIYSWFFTSLHVV